MEKLAPVDPGEILFWMNLQPRDDLAMPSNRPGKELGKLPGMKAA